MLVIPTPEQVAAAEAADAAAVAAAAETGGEDMVSAEETAAAEVAAAEAAAVEEAGAASETADDTQAQLTAEREQRIRLEGQLEGQRQAPPEKKAEPPVVLTRVQLRAAVDAGTIDEDGMEQLWADQNRAQTRREIGEDQDRRDTERESANFIGSETAKYFSAHPDIRKQGSADWNRLKTEYDYLTQTGEPDDQPDDPKNRKKELRAMRAAFGNSERIAEHTSTHRQTTSETSTSHGGATVAGGDRAVWDKVPKEIRPHYKGMVADGLLTLDEVKRTIPYMTQRPH
jgi:lipoprotein-anchoring transpeptidase ErfK/SrfK